jgi:alkenylglycerophosphocholine hydrolase
MGQGHPAVATVLVALTAVVAVVDWYAVETDRRRVEYVAKPLTLVVLIGAALALAPADPAVRVAVVVALMLSLAGDVLLVLPGERWFVFGLGAFLLAHVAYVTAFWIRGVGLGALLVGLVVVGAALALIGRRILVAAAQGPDSDLVAPVAVYIGVISLMVASAIGTRAALVIAGAVLFYCSDALIAWTRFIRDLRHGRLAVMVTYHLAQILLVLALV